MKSDSKIYNLLVEAMGFVDRNEPAAAETALKNALILRTDKTSKSMEAVIYRALADVLIKQSRLEEAKTALSTAEALEKSSEKDVNS